MTAMQYKYQMNIIWGGGIWPKGLLDDKKVTRKYAYATWIKTRSCGRSI